MTRPTARRVRAAFLLPLLLLLTGCIRLNMDFVINADDTAKLTANIGINKETYTQMGQPVPSGAEMCKDSPTTVGNATSTPYDDGTYVGCKIEGTGALTAISGDSQGLSITHANGVYTFAMNNSGSSSGGQLAANMFTEFRVSVTFPGEVVSHSGSSTVSGTTVTWTSAADLLSADGLKASGKDTAGLPWMLILGIGGGLVVVGGVVVAIVLLSRRKKAAPAAAYPGMPAGGQAAYPPQSGAPMNWTPSAPTSGYPPAPAGPQYPPAQPPQAGGTVPPGQYPGQYPPPQYPPAQYPPAQYPQSGQPPQYPPAGQPK